MRLVFVHGWGFDRHFWDFLAPRLSRHKQARVDLGFYGEASEDFPPADDCVLVGHSLGFIHGLKRKRNWRGCVAVNSFPRFVSKADAPGCVAPAQLRELKINLAADAGRALAGFYRLIGAEAPRGIPDIDRLKEGLDELREGDIAGDALPHHIPLLALATRDDPLVPVAVSQSFISLSGDFTLSWRDTGGHILPLSDPEWCADAIGNFIQTRFG